MCLDYDTEGVDLKIGEKFTPHPNLKKVYYTYLALPAIVMLLATLLPIWIVRILEPVKWGEIWPYLLIPPTVMIVIIAFVAYWIRRYYSSITYTLTKDEVVAERGVWWKMKQVVPYARVMSIDVIQGPISRHYGIGSVQIYTAGYTGPKGGTAGPIARGAEASIWGVPNFVKIKDAILEMVRGRPLFGAPREPNVGSEMLKELRKIRKAVEK
jgi:membrane protein YdbS with pleckstrin-like domain